MEKAKIEIIDAILKFMHGNGYKFNTNLNNESDLAPKFETKLFRAEWQSLVSENKFIRKIENSDYTFILTDEGKRVAEIGIGKYLKNQEKENNKSKTPIKISIIALCISAILPLIALCNLIFPENKTDNRNYDSGYRNHYTDSIIKQVFTNETFIEILKDSLKHDTKFLNELKLELKRNTTEKKITTP